MGMDWKEAADSDREAIRCVRNAMVKDLEAGIERAISIGEAKAKAVQERAIENIDTDSVSKVNGLVNEYISQLKQVKDRWPMGLGHYLLAKLERSMQGPGALEVDKISGKNGNFVFVNAPSVGLSSKLGAFERLAVSMRIYEDVLSKLTGSVSKKPIAAHKDISIGPPEWEGDRR